MARCGLLRPGMLTPRLVEALSGRAVAMVACGFFHTVLLTRDGVVLRFGSNALGQLGRATQEEEHVAVPDPGEVRHAALEGEEVVEVAAWGGCTAAVTAGGKTVVFGYESNGAVGVVWEAVM